MTTDWSTKQITMTISYDTIATKGDILESAKEYLKNIQDLNVEFHLLVDTCSENTCSENAQERVEQYDYPGAIQKELDIKFASVEWATEPSTRRRYGSCIKNCKSDFIVIRVNDEKKISLNSQNIFLCYESKVSYDWPRGNGFNMNVTVWKDVFDLIKDYRDHGPAKIMRAYTNVYAYHAMDDLAINQMQTQFGNISLMKDVDLLIPASSIIKPPSEPSLFVKVIGDMIYRRASTGHFLSGETCYFIAFVAGMGSLIYLKAKQ